MFGPGASFDFVAQVAVYGFWGILMAYYLVSSIWQTLRDRPELQLGSDVAQWVALLVVQVGLAGGIIYLSLGVGSNQIGL